MPTRLLAASAILILLAGCMSAEQKERQAQQQLSMEALNRQLKLLEGQVASVQTSLEYLTVEQTSVQRGLNESLANISGEVTGLPRAMATICAAPATQCETDSLIQTVVMSDDKMVLGELEHVWIEPPGSYLIARVDTGAHSSSLHADNMMEFERDGEDWVRFELILSDESAVLERPVTRYVRVFQQADPEGTRRPVVALRLRLGDVQETFEFTLADRSHLDQPMLLGRNFLTDMALVDVGKQFVQPRNQPERD